jgi:alpha-galactosidase
MALVCLPPSSWAATPTADELARASHWIAENFTPAKAIPAAETEAAAATRPGLVVLANHGQVLLNGRPDGRPLKIAGTVFRRGLLCHAVSRVVVRLPGPGKRFSSVVGVDTNAGGGSIVFSVKVGGQEAFRSGMMRCGERGAPVSVDLGGAKEFTIEAGDAGDGIACDHANWADAKATLIDGTEVWLAKLPILSPELRKRSVSVPPFSFVYGGKPSDHLLSGWRLAQTVEKLDAQRTRRTQTYTDPNTGLVVRCVMIEYRDYPTVEWTLHFRNAATTDTPILEDIQALDTRIRPGGSGRFLLHHHLGSPCTARDFEPLETPLGPGVSKRISAAGGRPTNSDLSYFNLEGDGAGVILAVGWPGQWAAEFVREQRGDLRVCAGQERTHFKLHPGEEVRTPLIVLQFWQHGDWVRAQNVWRRWMIAHNLPRPGGKLVPTHYGGCFGSALPRADEEIEQIDAALREGTKLDYWFIDAGWYPCAGSWANVGTWNVDPQRFPRGLREVAGHLHARGIKFVVWFEPERVSAGSWLTENHPEWVLGGRNGGLLNLGNPETWKWMVEHFDGLVSGQGVDVYRQDFNIDPLTFWQANDTEDRQGITEIKHVTGYLAYWDELLRRHPDLLIDTCASGGRRNDLETLRRSVPLLRSDWAVAAFSPAGAIGQQCQTYGLSLWSPYHGTGAPLSDAYTMRSSFAPAYRIGWDARKKDTDRALLRRTVHDFRQVEKYLLGDFYPLTPYSLESNVWMAWQFDRPELGEGVVQTFRRAESPEPSARFKLRGLEVDAEYALTDLDSGQVRRTSGRELAGAGLIVTARSRPGAEVILYRKIR